MPDITICRHCAMRIIPTAAGDCPACGKSLTAPVEPPPPPPRRRSRHPFLFLIFLGLVVAGFWRYLNREQDAFDAIVVDLSLIWIGCIGIVLVNVMTWRKR